MTTPDSVPDLNKIIQNAQEKGRTNFNSDFDEAMKDIKNNRTVDQSGENISDDEKKKAWQEYDRNFENNDETVSDDAKFTEPETIEAETIKGNHGPDILDKERPGVTVDAEYIEKEKGGTESSKALVATDNTYEKKAIDNFEKEIAEARKEYLEMDYKKTDAIGRIMKFFGGNKNVNTEKDQDIAYYKKNYEDKLAEWRNFLIEDARKHGANDEELAKIYVQFRTEQKVILADEHDNVKIEQQEGSMEGRIRKAMIGAHKWYKDQPVAAKLAVSAILIGAGAGLSFAGIGAGTLVSGIFFGSVALKRFVTGAITGVGTTLSLETLGQNRAKKKIEKEKQEFLKEMMGKSEDERYKSLNDRMDKIIVEEKNALKKIKNQDTLQLAAGATVGTLLGSGMAADFFKWGFHGVAEYFGLGHGGAANMPHHVAGAHGGVIDESKIPKGYGIAPPSQGDILTIHQGSSIEKTLIEHLKDQGVKNPGHEAHKIFLNYMHDNKESIIQKVGDGEYHKMLKDGMVNVKAGTGLNIVMENGGLKLHDITGNISHIEHPNVSHIIESHDVAAKDVIAQHDSVNEVNNFNSADGGAEVLHNITSEHLNAPVAGVEHVSGHQIGGVHNGLETFNSAELNLPEGSSVTFGHNINGELIVKKMVFSSVLHGGNGQELFVGNFHEKILENVPGYKANLIESALKERDQKLLGFLKIHDALLKNGQTKEAAAVLRSINNVMDITEKGMHLDGIFDRSKLPSL